MILKTGRVARILDANEESFFKVSAEVLIWMLNRSLMENIQGKDICVAGFLMNYCKTVKYNKVSTS